MSCKSDKLLIDSKNAYLSLSDDVKSKIKTFCDGYKDFLNKSKTERESVKYILNKIKSSGFKEFDASKKYNVGDKIYYINRDKALIMATIGQEPLDAGVSMVIAHIDSPRIDLTPKPLYEEANLAFLKTQYYGGIKKYQWTAIPLSMHGVVEKKDGSYVEINIGESEDDPVFCITDLLPHLATEQMQRVSTKLIKGDELNILFGSIPCDDKEVKTKIKYQIMELLNEKYGIIEQDLISADLSFVPAFKAKDLGLDSSMIGSYGHDDRVCAYTALEAHLSSSVPNKTVVTVFY